jgi:hypothetical protein
LVSCNFLVYHLLEGGYIIQVQATIDDLPGIKGRHFIPPLSVTNSYR